MLYYFNMFMTYLSLFLLFCAIISKVSTTGEYYVRLLILTCSCLFTGTVLIPYGLWNYNKPWKASRLSADIMEPVGPLLGITLETKGSENIDKKQAYVVICNHQSSLDMLPVMQVWKHFDRAAMVAKKELQYLGTFGLGIKMCGTVFVDRASSEKGRAAINDAGKRARETGTTLWIFPEGTRHHGTGMLPFKKGAFHVATNIGLPILPVVVSEYNFLDHKKKIFGKGKISIQIMKPIPTENFVKTKENLDALIEETRDAMVKVQKSMMVENDTKKSN